MENTKTHDQSKPKKSKKHILENSIDHIKIIVPMNQKNIAVNNTF
jgi:hypothetical protein